VRPKGAVALVVVCVVSLVLAGCGGGGGGGHTYVLVPHASNGFVKGLYVTIVSPLPIPMHIMAADGAKFVGHPVGPQKCAYTKTVHYSHGPLAFLNGKRVTFKISGTNPGLSNVCLHLRKASFNAKIGGG
jgi:hypothetical protein